MCRLTWGGGYLGLSPSCLEGLFHFTVCLLHPHFLSQTRTRPFLPLSSSPSSPILWHRITGPNPCISFSSSIHPSICPHSSLPPSCPSFLSSAFLCSAVTLSSLAHVLLQAYSVPDAEFYCHSVYTGTLWVRASVTTSTMRASVIFVSDSNPVTSHREFHRRLFSLQSRCYEFFFVLCVYKVAILHLFLYSSSPLLPLTILTSNLVNT